VPGGSGSRLSASDEIGCPHENSAAVRLQVSSVKFSARSPLDASPMLLERLHTSFLCWGKVGLQHFQRQSADTAANMPMPIIHVEVNNVAREMMVPRVACGRQRHDALFLKVSTRSFRPSSTPRQQPTTKQYQWTAAVSMAKADMQS
jgi:hypothetical protein